LSYNGKSAFVSANFVKRAKPVQVIIEKALGLVNKLVRKASGPFSFIKLSGSCGAGTTATRTARPDPRRCSSESNSGVLSGFIRIKAKHYLLSVTPQDACVVIGKSGALRSDNILNASHEASDEVQLAFTNHSITGVEDGALGFVQPEKHLAFGKDRESRAN
jgi:hypothetical protein